MTQMILRRFRLLKLVHGQFATSVRSGFATDGALTEADEIVVPSYIPRGPTEILEALATTVRRDPTAPHYKFHDDPYLYPFTNARKRIYALSQESGRKAAHWIKQEHKELFIYRELDPPMRKKVPYSNADPIIDAFLPKQVYNSESDVSIDDLKGVIKKRYVTDAITVYKLLETKNPEALTAEIKQNLLELLCFYNAEDPFPDEWLEEKWMQPGGGVSQEKYINTWKKNGLAREIFDSLENKSSEAYCAIIQGMCKHFEVKEAYNLYEECRQKNIALNVSVYNSLLSTVRFIKQGFELQWQLMNSLLNDMSSLKISPDTNTLNAVLESLSSLDDKECKDVTLNVIAEFMNKCQVEPSLATWYFVLKIFYKEKNLRCDVLNSIINTLEGKSFKIVHPKDILFFSMAMQVCRYHVQDFNVAQKINNILLHGNNYNLIGDFMSENAYYRYFLTLAARNTLIETLLELYQTYVPHIYTPDSIVMEEVLRAIDINGSCEHFPLMWSHLVLFGHYQRSNLVQFILQSMVRNLPINMAELGTSTDKSLKSEDGKTKELEVQQKYGESPTPFCVEKTFGEIAWDIWNKVNEIDGKNKFEWTGSMLNDIVMLLVTSERITDAIKVVDLLTSNDGSSFGVPSSPKSLIYFSKECLKVGQPAYSVIALTYLSECGFSEPVEVSKEILKDLLNRSPDEIEELIQQATIKTTQWISDSTVSDLIAIANADMKTMKSKNINKSNTPDTSSSSSDSDSSDEDERSK